MEAKAITSEYNLSPQEQRTLFARCFPETEGDPISSEAYYLWKFKSAPVSPTSYEFHTFSVEGKLASYYGVIPLSYAAQGKKTVAGLVSEIMTDPRVQRGGLFTELGTLALSTLTHEGVAFLIGHFIRPQMVSGHQKLGWEVLFHSPLYVRVLRSPSLLRRVHLSSGVKVADGVLATSAYFMRGIRAVRGRKGSTETYIQCASAKEFFNQREKEYGVFFDSWKDNEKIFLNKTSQFFAWRLGAPETEYKIVTLEKGGEILAFACTRVCSLQGVPTLALLDIMVLTKHSASLGKLYNFLDELALQEGCEVIVVMANPSMAKECQLFWNGYLPTQEKFICMAKSLQEERASLLKNEQLWRISWLDTDDL